MDKKIRMIALDLDGTFLNEQKQITEGNRKAVMEAASAGVQTVISTGRPYTAIPVEELVEMGIEYAITVNGAEIYKLSEKKCVFYEGMDKERALEIISDLKKLDVRIDILVEGYGYGEKTAYERISELGIPEVMKDYLRETRIQIDDLQTFIIKKGLPVLKITLNFYQNADGTYRDYEKAVEILEKMEDIDFLSGGYHNLEITKKGVTKGRSLQVLAEMLGIDMKETMACGDSENDIDIIKTAEVGVAMANASEETKAAADYITLSNEEDGVAHIINKMVLL